MMFKARVRDCCMPPRGYREAYYDYARQESICYPFGIHWLAMFAYWLWLQSFRRPFRSQITFNVGSMDIEHSSVKRGSIINLSYVQREAGYFGNGMGPNCQIKTLTVQVISKIDRKATDDN